MRIKCLTKKSIKKSKSIQKGIKDIKEGKTTSFKNIQKDWKEEDKWNKKHPILTKFKRIGWWLHYGIKNKIEDIPLNIKIFIQRGKRGWSVRDIWGFDYYLSKVISEGLKHLNKHKHGFQITVWDKHGNFDDKINIKRWEEILKKIIYAFQLAHKISSGDRETYLPKLSKKFQKKYKCLTKEENETMNEGFKLFTKHFFDLWD